MGSVAYYERMANQSSPDKRTKSALPNQDVINPPVTKEASRNLAMIYSLNVDQDAFYQNMKKEMDPMLLE